MEDRDDVVLQDIKLLVFAEVERWKGLHDAELDRRKRWTIGSVILGFLAAFGAGYLSFDHIVGMAVDTSSKPSFDIIARYRDSIVTESDKARDALQEAQEIAKSSAAAANEAVQEKLREIAAETTSPALQEFVAAEVAPLRSALQQTLIELEYATFEISQRSAGIATHPPYKDEMTKHSNEFVRIARSITQ